MPLILGKDGKRRAVEANAGITRTTPTLYFGLMVTYPANADTLTLSALLTAGTEHTPTGTEGEDGCWYAGGRKVITFGAYGAITPLVCTSNNGGPPVNQWLNRVGAMREVGGLFIATVQVGTSGEVLWVGYPDVGTIPVIHGRGVKWDNGLVDLKVI